MLFIWVLLKVWGGVLLVEPVDVRYPGLRLATFCGVFYLVLGLVYGGRQVLLGVGHGSDLIELVDGGVEGQCCW